MCVAKNNGDVIGWGQTMKGAVYQARNTEFYSVAMGNHQEIVSNKMTWVWPEVSKVLKARIWHTTLYILSMAAFALQR